jgi:hypothetical protein
MGIIITINNSRVFEIGISKQSVLKHSCTLNLLSFGIMSQMTFVLDCVPGHNYTAEQKLLHKLQAGNSYIPDKTCSKSTS